ncbi:MAG TPA: helix-turn-helix domain-containing protein [Pyrinomonadaceae bacterium]|jgi:transcriptional regulator with GAF, ATPase, and Fis domain
MRNTEQLVVVRELALTLLEKVESLEETHDSFPASDDGAGFYEMVGAYEKFLIRRALLRAGGNQARAARMLRLRPTTLHNKIKAYNIRLDAKVVLYGGDAVAADCPESCARSQGAA